MRLLVVEGEVEPNRRVQVAEFGATYGGAYAGVLRRLAPDAQCTLLNPKQPDGVDLADFDGAVITGSSLNAHRDEPPVRRRAELVRAILAAGVPIFGSCWGLQIAAQACGGQVAANPLGREIGFARNIAPTPAGRAHPMLHGRPAAFDAPAIHFDIVTQMPPGGEALASNAYAGVQAACFAVEGVPVWGTQYHPEFSLGELAAILRRATPSLVADGRFAEAAQGHGFADDLAALDRGPRPDIAWRYGVSADITDFGRRTTEIGNWIATVVRPRCLS